MTVRHILKIEVSGSYILYQRSGSWTVQRRRSATSETEHVCHVENVDVVDSMHLEPFQTAW